MGTCEFEYIRFPKKEYLVFEVAKIVANKFGIQLDEDKSGPERTKKIKVLADGAESFVDTIRRALNKKVDEFEKLDIYKDHVLRRKESDRKTYYANVVVEQVINEDLYGWLCGRTDGFDDGTTSREKYNQYREKKGEKAEDWEPREYRIESPGDSEECELELSLEQYEEFKRLKTDIVIDFVYDRYIKNRTMPDISCSDVKYCLSCVSHKVKTIATIRKETKEVLAAQGITFIPLNEAHQAEHVVSQGDIDTAIELALRQKKLELVMEFVCKEWIEINEELLKHDIGYAETADSNSGPKHIYKDVFERKKDPSRYYKIRKKVY